MRLAEIETVTNNLSLLRGGAGLSQQELADAIGVSRKTISTIETARFMPSVVIALKLATHFSVPVEQIFQLSE
ncbi:transcriptional regulator [Aliidiomarina shirensis]|uniref:Transcriptional regulator n=1 Tax=Aliidiomarina shirensis TaxID=1048642 RepID=A0A432WQU0_9GAMM|nr:helix-turn-helix transcriptional regulator [Aliidiomarina shirensis]RUO36166.1 transcriptional regulator [Aliidiomarina shirensis]